MRLFQLPHLRKDFRMAQLPIGWKHYISRIFAATIQNNLHVVGREITFHARLMTVDKDSGPHKFGKGPGVFHPLVPSPNQLENARLVEVFRKTDLAIEDLGVETLPVAVLRNAVRNELSVRQADCQWAAL